MGSDMKKNSLRLKKGFFLSKNTLAVKVWYVIGGALLAFIVMFAISFLVLSDRSRRDHEIKESETILNSMAGSITANIESYKDISRLVMLDDKVVSFLRAPGDEIGAGIKNDTKVAVYDILIASEYVDSVFIFRDDQYYVKTGRGLYFIDYDLMEDTSWQADIRVRRGGAVILLNGNGAVTVRYTRLTVTSLLPLVVQSTISTRRRERVCFLLTFLPACLTALSKVRAIRACALCPMRVSFLREMRA